MERLLGGSVVWAFLCGVNLSNAVWLAKVEAYDWMFITFLAAVYSGFLAAMNSNGALEVSRGADAPTN